MIRNTNQPGNPPGRVESTSVEATSICARVEPQDPVVVELLAKIINLGQPELFDYEDYMSRIIQAGKIYAGSWPPLPAESTAEEYFTRILAPLEKGGDQLRLSIQGFEFGKTSQELCRLWYVPQGAHEEEIR